MYCFPISYFIRAVHMYMVHMALFNSFKQQEKPNGNSLLLKKELIESA